MDEITSLLPHMDARMLVSMNLGRGLSKDLKMELKNEIIVCPLEFFGGINACFLYKSEGHARKNCPLIKKNVKGNNPSPKSVNAANPSLPLEEDANPTHLVPFEPLIDAATFANPSSVANANDDL